MFSSHFSDFEECEENEFYTCGLTCVETCRYKPVGCQKNCRFGCYCKDGYVRKSNMTGSPCIKREHCRRRCPEPSDPRCGKNEEYQECGPACPPTCDYWRYPLPKQLVMCRAKCGPGCFCKKDFYRSDDGKCVRPADCCRANEKFNSCGSACVETCQYQPQFCTEQCVPGCFCASEKLVRSDNTTDSRCIERSECEK